MKLSSLFLIVFMCCGIGLPFHLSAQEEGPSLKDKKVLFIYGGWKGHQPIQCLEFLLPWLESEGAIVDTFGKLDIYSNELYMSKVDLIIQIHTMSTISGEQEKGLLKAIKNGTGIAGWHGGLGDAFRNNPSYQFMVGGQWVAHPGGVIDYTVKIVDKNDPISSGLKDFDMHSEQYYMHVDPNVKVLATTEFSGDHASWIKGCTMPVVWKKMYGKGRVFYTSLGHVVEDLKVYESHEILKRGIRWASESKYAPAEEWIKSVY